MTEEMEIPEGLIPEGLRITPKPNGGRPPVTRRCIAVFMAYKFKKDAYEKSNSNKEYCVTELNRLESTGNRAKDWIMGNFEKINASEHVVTLRRNARNILPKHFVIISDEERMLLVLGKKMPNGVTVFPDGTKGFYWRPGLGEVVEFEFQNLDASFSMPGPTAAAVAGWCWEKQNQSRGKIM